MIKKKLIGFLFGVFSLSLFSSASATELKLATFEPPKAFIASKILGAGAEKVNTCANGKLNVKMYAGGVLGSPPTQYDIVTKGDAHISWTQIETGSALTWKYPSCVLKGDNSIGEFYSVALSNNFQQADTGTKMIHIGNNTKSTIFSNGISAGNWKQTYRGEVKVMKNAINARNRSECDSILIGSKSGAHTFPYLDIRNASAKIEHEATTSKIGEEQLFYCNQRGIDTEDAIALIINGFCKSVFKKLPMEFAVEAQKLMEVSLEGSVG